jgi:hypothetical protein
MSFRDIKITCFKAIAACLTSESKLEVSRGVATSFGRVLGDIRMVPKSVGGDEGILKVIGRPGQASCQSRESNAFCYNEGGGGGVGALASSQ